MIFVPFTGIDNHKKSVTFGAALLGNETADLYIWLLKCFLSAFGKQPKIVVTDQDAALAKAVKAVFTESIHRLCMWHIGKKLTDKVCPNIIFGTDFRQRLQNLVWNPCIDYDVFEEKWIRLIEEFNLGENKWLKEMFRIRDRWIPVFFKGVNLSGLMRTTSLSESQKNFF
ncbi:hypothetical protein L2E82_18153 [Cichorium intybus]|uniref:Uncharacterized protein n=1 Tax=Cichorium intybus TaxID=13427 RepID=A0ACB9F910_CICIN|nr:hypothetical protein L2E82_18153 [Cichorium intybus]